MIRTSCPAWRAAWAMSSSPRGSRRRYSSECIRLPGWTSRTLIAAPFTRRMHARLRRVIIVSFGDSPGLPSGPAPATPVELSAICDLCMDFNPHESRSVEIPRAPPAYCKEPAAESQQDLSRPPAHRQFGILAAEDLLVADHRPGI